MRSLAPLAFALVASCGRGAESGDTGALLTDHERSEARNIPATGTVEFVVDGLSGPLEGRFNLQVGPGDTTKFDFAGRSEYGQTQLVGSYDLQSEAGSLHLADGIVASYQATPGYASLADNRFTFSVSTPEGQKHYAGRFANVRIESSGIMAAEFRGVDGALIDYQNQTIPDGSERSFYIRGRVTGVCDVYINDSGAWVMDPNNNDARCRAILGAP